MATYVHNLADFNLDKAVPVYIRQTEIMPVKLDDPAIKTMTDLKTIKVISITPDRSMEFAEQLMKNAGVRMLLVVNPSSQLAGLVTARDIMGEKPVAIMTRDRIKREEIQVSQIMTPRAELNPFNMLDVKHAKVRDVIHRLRDAGRQHAIVIEEQDDGKSYFVRGIFSITQIGRQLGVEISADGHVQSFAELERLIV